MGRKIGTLFVILLLLAALGVVGYYIYTYLNPTPTPEPVVDQTPIRPEIKITQEYNEDDNTVVISVLTSTEDAAGIQEIVLPDDTNVYADKTEYVATENKEYVFKVIAANGETNSAKVRVEDINEESFNNPYVPEGFSVINGSSSNLLLTVINILYNNYKLLLTYSLNISSLLI